MGNIIDIENNEKVKSSKGYEYWATKHNLQVASDIVVLMREKDLRHFLNLMILLNPVLIKDKAYKMKLKLSIRNFLLYLKLWNKFIL